MPLEWEGRYEAGGPLWGEVGIHGVPRARGWDTVVTVEAPDVRGDRVEFVTLPDGTVLVEEERGDAELAPLADAVERELRPPYRARGVRQGESLWGVSASRIRVERLDIEGDELTLTVRDGARELAVDGERAFGSAPALEALGEGESFVVAASRLDGDLFEVRVSPL